MKKFAMFLLPTLALACAGSMAAVTSTTTTTTHTTTTRHTTRIVPAQVPTIVTIHTHPAKRHVRHRVVRRPVPQQSASTTTVTQQLGGPPAAGATVTTTVHKQTVHSN